MDTNELRVLVAEDDQISSLILKTYIASKGYHVDMAVNGKEAVEMFKKWDCYDLIITDLRMPELNGFEAVKIIRKMESELNHPRSFIVVLSADAQWSGKYGDLNGSIDGFLEKPIFLKKIDNLLEKAILLKRVRCKSDNQ